MREEFQDQLAAACRRKPIRGRVECCWATAWDLARSIPRERLRDGPPRESHETPKLERDDPHAHRSVVR